MYVYVWRMAAGKYMTGSVVAPRLCMHGKKKVNQQPTRCLVPCCHASMVPCYGVLRCYFNTHGYLVPYLQDKPRNNKPSHGNWQ